MLLNIIENKGNYNPKANGCVQYLQKFRGFKISLNTNSYTVKKYFQDLLSQHFFLLSNQLK